MGRAVDDVACVTPVELPLVAGGDLRRSRVAGVGGPCDGLTLARGTELSCGLAATDDHLEAFGRAPLVAPSDDVPWARACALGTATRLRNRGEARDFDAPLRASREAVRAVDGVEARPGPGGGRRAWLAQAAIAEPPPCATPLAARGDGRQGHEEGGAACAHTRTQARLQGRGPARHGSRGASRVSLRRARGLSSR